MKNSMSWHSLSGSGQRKIENWLRRGWQPDAYFNTSRKRSKHNGRRFGDREVARA